MIEKIAISLYYIADPCPGRFQEFLNIIKYTLFMLNGIENAIFVPRTTIPG